MNETVYAIYKATKKLIERTEECCEKDHSQEELFADWKNAIVHFDASSDEYAKRYEYEKMVEEKCEPAFKELKAELVKVMFAFTEKYAVQGEDCFYPYVGNVLVDALAACLSEAQYQIQGTTKFTSKQIDHICYQIGEWYLDMKPLLEGTHNLGYMKEKLKVMICGEER